jgi:hypothetical protein
MKRKIIFILLVSLLIFTACSNTSGAGGQGDPSGAGVSFRRDIMPVLEEFAARAHGGTGGVFLENYNDVMNYVVPGKPEESQLYKDITGDGTIQMPPRNPLPKKTIQLFYDWIKEGALNN